MAEKKNVVFDSSLSVLKDQDIFNELIKQLEKDIQLAGLDADILNDNLENYIKSLKLFLGDKLRTDPEKLRALFYRIDIKEDDIVNLFFESESNDGLLNTLSKVLILRELQKISNRKKFRRT